MRCCARASRFRSNGCAERFCRILFNQRKGEIIRAHEEELCARAAEMGEVKIFADEKPKKDE